MVPVALCSRTGLREQFPSIKPFYPSFPQVLLPFTAPGQAPLLCPGSDLRVSDECNLKVWLVYPKGPHLDYRWPPPLAQVSAIAELQIRPKG